MDMTLSVSIHTHEMAKSSGHLSIGVPKDNPGILRRPLDSQTAYFRLKDTTLLSLWLHRRCLGLDKLRCLRKRVGEFTFFTSISGLIHFCSDFPILPPYQRRALSFGLDQGESPREDLEYLSLGRSEPRTRVQLPRDSSAAPLAPGANQTLARTKMRMDPQRFYDSDDDSGEGDAVPTVSGPDPYASPVQSMSRSYRSPRPQQQYRPQPPAPPPPPATMPRAGPSPPTPNAAFAALKMKGAFRTQESPTRQPSSSSSRSMSLMTRLPLDPSSVDMRSGPASVTQTPRRVDEDARRKARK